MATSPIYSWPEPDNTDLVKNGALAIRTLGNAIDTTMGTMVAKTIIDAKGDLIAGSAADTALRLAVGANGETLVADSSTSTGLKWAAAPSPNSAVGYVSASQGTSSASYVDLTTSSAVTVTTGTKALVILSAQYENGVSALTAYMSFAVSGATTLAASDSRASKLLTGAFAWVGTLSTGFILTGLTAGSNVFTTKFRTASGGSMSWAERYITVIDMGS